jgi:hypothetical protein
MSRTPRILRALILAVMVVSVLVAPAAAAPKEPVKNAPSLAVSMSRTTVLSDFEGYVAFTFTSTGAKRASGFARLQVPSRMVPLPPTTVPAFLSPLQMTDPTQPGYMRVERTSCLSAAVRSSTTGNASAGTVTSIPSIEVAFDCQPGQSFVIHWFTLTHNFNIDGANPNDMWPIQVSSRKDLDAQWGSQATLTLGVRPYFLTLPPLPFLTPPVRLVDAAPVTGDPARSGMILLTGDTILLDEPVTSKITINHVFRADTGEELVMVDPYAFRVDQTLQVISCLDINVKVPLPPDPLQHDFTSDCGAMPNVVQVNSAAPGSFSTLGGTVLTSETAVIAGVFDFLTAPATWKAAESRCLFRGGVYYEHPLTNELWNCVLPAPAPNNDRYYFVLNDLAQTEYCPTGKIRNDPTLVERQIIACLS